MHYQTLVREYFIMLVTERQTQQRLFMARIRCSHKQQQQQQIKGYNRDCNVNYSCPNSINCGGDHLYKKICLTHPEGLHFYQP